MANELIIAKTVKEAASYLRKGSAILAGGTEVNRLGSSVEADTLVSIGRIDGLDQVSKCKIGSESYIKIGAMCTFQEAVENEKLPGYFRDACLYMSSRTKRNMATIGGNVACLRDDSYLLATLMAVHAQIELLKSGKTETVCICRYIKEEKLRKYLILSVMIPAAKIIVASKRYANTAASHAFLTMAVAKLGKQLSYGVCAKNSGLYLLDSKEDLAKIKFKSDMYGSISYKKYLLDVTSEDLTKTVMGGAK